MRCVQQSSSQVASGYCDLVSVELVDSNSQSLIVRYGTPVAWFFQVLDAKRSGEPGACVLSLVTRARYACRTRAG